MPTPQRPKLLLEVLAALGATPVTEAPIQGGPHEHIVGLAEGGKVWVDPAHSTVSTLIHEILHVGHPKWTEEYVLNRETYIMNRLTPEEVQEIYRLYQEKVKRTSRPKKA